MAVTLKIMCAFTEARLDTFVRANGMYAFGVIYNAIYGFTWGPIPWLLPAEFNFIIGMSSPSAFSGIGGYYYVIIAGFCLFSTGLAFFYYVETSKSTLEEISIAFGDKAFAREDSEVIQASGLGRGETTEILA